MYWGGHGTYISTNKLTNTHRESYDRCFNERPSALARIGDIVIDEGTKWHWKVCPSRIRGVLFVRPTYNRKIEYQDGYFVNQSSGRFEWLKVSLRLKIPREIRLIVARKLP
jgi:hypothetical protein